MTKQPLDDLQVQLEAVQKKLDDLETNQRTILLTASRRYRSGFSKGLVLGLLPFMASILLLSSILYGQGGGEAIVIAPNGNVGIGTQDPKAALEVKGAGSAIRFGDGAGQAHLAAGSDFFGLRDTNNQDRLTILQSNGYVGIGTTSPLGKLHVVASGSFGAENADGTAQTGNVPILAQSDGTAIGVLNGSGRPAFALTIDAVGTTTNARGVPTFYDKYDGAWHSSIALKNGNVGIGVTTPEVKLDVVGNARIQGTVSSFARYQRDDQAEGTYEISPRYHLSLTAPNYGGKTKTIPQEMLEALCGDQDGCEFRLGMTRWDNSTQTETASRASIFYYSGTDGRWRASTDELGIDGNGATQHVMNIWGTCFFTDGVYANYQDLSDKQKGMQLLVWNGLSSASRTCELTLID